MITASCPLHTGRLVLTPTNPQLYIEAGPLAGQLRDIGLVGPALTGRGDAFETGEQFLQLIAFTGCAVQLDSTPLGPGGPFVHVELDCTPAEPRLLAGRNTRPPRCPSCGKPLTEWRDQVQGWQPGQAPDLHCTHCTTGAPGWCWHWRQHGGFGRSFVRVEEVFPGEAAPLPALLDGLRDLGVGDWHHFYVQD
jgi:hypothetical protein